MGSINVDPHRIIVPLKDWITISNFVQQGNRSESSQNDYAGNSPARYSNGGIYSSENGVTGREQVKIDDIMRSIRMAILLVDRLVRKDDDIDLSGVEGAAPLNAHDISVENFLVEMRVPREVPITDSLSNADDIMRECSFPQIKSVLEGAFDVKLVPALQNTVGFQVDEVLEHEIFRQLGILFYELFSQDEPSLPRSLSNQDHSVSLQHRAQCEGNLRNEGGPLSSDEARDYNGTCKDLKKLDVAGPVDLLQQKSLPLSVCRLVIDLIECGIHEEGMFQSLKDVKSELTQILNEPDIFLNENNIGDMSMRFCSAKLFGRNDVLSTLIQAALMTPFLAESNVSTVVLIEGDPGAGKSTLVHAIKEPICNHGWQFLSCKFDRLTENQPLSTISSTFNEFFQRIATILSQLEDGIPMDDAVIQYVRRTASLVETHLSAPGIVFLSKLIPSFRSIFPDIFQRVVDYNEDSDSDGEQRVSVENDDSDFDDVQRETSHGKERHASFNSDDIGANNNDFVDDDSCDCLVSDTIKNRLHYLFQELTQAISSPDTPIMLFLDDLQWADKESLELLTSLVVDVDQLDAHQRCISFVVTYRSNEKDKNQSLVDCIESIERSNATQVTHMQLGGMDIEGTNAMIADALKLPIRLTRPLSVAVHQKTLGNPLFVKVFLTMLFEEHAISYSFKKKRWLWDMNTIHQRSMDRELAMVLSEKLLSMSRKVQETLTFVACFGMRVRRDVLSMASCDSEEASRILSCLKIAVKESILDEDDEYFSFPHDLIQQAAYERVHEKDLRSYHFSIGLQILKNAIHTTRAEPLSRVSFIALEQIIMAKDMTVPDIKVRMSLALLFLRAGKHSIQIAAFPSALSYFERGLSFLGEDGWELNHELSLRLHESMCHACYLNALPDRVPVYTDIVISHSDDFMDQVKCHHITMQTLASTGNFKKAFDKFFEVMKQLGEELSPNVDPSVIFPGMYATKNDLSKYSTEDLMNVPKMTDKRKQWAMTFMDSIIPCVFVISPLFLPTIANRMITLSLRYGLTKESAFGLYAYCYCLGCMLQDIDEGYRWIKVTRLMLEKFNAGELCPKLKLVQYSFLIYMKEPLQSVTNVLFHCREEIMMVGDIEYAILSAHFHCQFAVLTGASLLNAEKECNSLSKEMVRLKQTQSILENASIHHMVLQLIGSDEDSFAIPGISYKDEDEVLDHLESSGNMVFANSIYTHRVVTACFFRRFEYAADMIEKYHSEVSKGSLVLSAVMYAFYEGLVSFRMARSRPNDEKKWLVMGESAIQRYKTWTTHSEWNFENKLLLLEAESLFCQGNYDSAEKKYISSIESARRHKFVHEQGLALDLLASMYKFRGDPDKEAECLEGAFGCYETWGAHGLLSHIRDE